MEHFNPTGHPLNNACEITKLAACRRCGDDKLAWRRSTRTGRWYLCDVEACGRWATRENPTLRRYFVLGMKPHKCTS
ncbi:hypothetical protein OG618_37315 (plasmid) [Kitasatospora sp. NBC_01246]|uniref:hypothetical protein n=1 Tax=Kitasatospora sp. NBC_01246 TaxID=2903570 RepID=UPI002E37447F|nr:hypothetical protein [Kitasatospora sp. NBC_01246]